jgi:hypothetical protein
MTIVGPEMSVLVQSEVDVLRRAVNAGDMDGVDASTARLLRLTVDCRSIDLSEQEWQTFTNEIRRENPAFESNYLLPAEVCVSLFPTIRADEQVLELPIDGEMDEDEIDV